MNAENPEILYRNRRIAVCVKSPGQLSEPGGRNSLPELLSQRLHGLGEPDEIHTVHRLDKVVGGLMVFARDGNAAGDLIRQMEARQVSKDYYAVLRGIPEASGGVLEDLLFHDSTKNKTYVVRRLRKGVRTARLRYRRLSTVRDGDTALTLVRIRLETGRTHQIRAQFSARQLPLLGDIRYGSRDDRCGPALWSCYLRFRDPAEGRMLTFSCRPPAAFPWNLFPEEAYTPYTLFENEEVTP